MRTFELGGVGAIQLAPATDDHEKAFKPGEEIFIFHDAEECVELIQVILALPKDAADQVRNRARERSLQGCYSYACRSRQALDAIEQHLG
jgi:spore maturation protein CgeB